VLPYLLLCLSETFIEEACLFILPVLATVVMRRGKESVACVAAAVLVHRILSLLSDMYRFLEFIRFFSWPKKVKFDDSFSCFDTVHKRDRQTDGLTDKAIAVAYITLA